MKTVVISGHTFAVSHEVCEKHKTPLVAHKDHLGIDLCRACDAGQIGAMCAEVPPVPISVLSEEPPKNEVAEEQVASIEESAFDPDRY